MVWVTEMKWVGRARGWETMKMNKKYFGNSVLMVAVLSVGRSNNCRDAGRLVGKQRSVHWLHIVVGVGSIFGSIRIRVGDK